MEANKSVPPEIIELICSHCDCSTLRVLKRVHPDWEDVVEALLKKRCLDNIPDLDLLRYKHKRSASQIGEMWVNKLEDICENWEKWQNIERNITFGNVPFIYDMRYISCVAVFDDYVAVGLDTGAVNLYDQSERLLRTFPALVEREPQTIHFVPGASREDEPSALLVEYSFVTAVHDFRQKSESCLFEHQKVFAAYKRFICGVAIGGTVTIAQIIREKTCTNHRGKITFLTLKLIQLDAPSTNHLFASLSSDKCLILSDDKVFEIVYKDANNNIEGKARQVTSLGFAMNSVPVLWRDALIFYDKVLITNSQPRADTGQIFEVFLLRSGFTPSTKTFCLSEMFASLITCVYLYGNTLVLGFANGEILFYEIRDFKDFDLRKPSKVFSSSSKLGRIVCIDVVESRGKREYFAAGPSFVRRITGKTKIKAV